MEIAQTALPRVEISVDTHAHLPGENQTVIISA